MQKPENDTTYNIQQQHIFTTMDDDTLLPTRRELDVDLTFEIEEFDSTSVTGDGLLYYPDNSSLMETRILLLKPYCCGGLSNIS